MCAFITKVSLTLLLFLVMFMIATVRILIRDLFAFSVLKILFRGKFTPRNDRTPKFASIKKSAIIMRVNKVVKALLFTSGIIGF